MLTLAFAGRCACGHPFAAASEKAAEAAQIEHVTYVRRMSYEAKLLAMQLGTQIAVDPTGPITLANCEAVQA